MNRLTALCIDNILILSTWLKSIFGEHYEFNIVRIISMMYWNLFRVKIVCGGYHTFLILNNEVWAWGCNGSGRLGVGHTQNRNSPQKLNLMANVIEICGGYS